MLPLPSEPRLQMLDHGGHLEIVHQKADPSGRSKRHNPVLMVDETRHVFGFFPRDALPIRSTTAPQETWQPAANSQDRSPPHPLQGKLAETARPNPNTHRYQTPVILPARSSQADVPREEGPTASRGHGGPPLPTSVIRCGFPSLATIIRRGLKASRPCSLRSSKHKKKTLISRLPPDSHHLFFALRALTHTPSGLGLLGEKTTKTG